MCLFSTCPAGTCDGCTFHFLWESASACPRCSEDDYHQIEGACKGGVQVIHTHTHTHTHSLSLLSLRRFAFSVFILYHHQTLKVIKPGLCSSPLSCLLRHFDFIHLSPSILSRKLCMCGTSQSCAPKARRCLRGAPFHARPSLCG